MLLRLSSLASGLLALGLLAHPAPAAAEQVFAEWGFEEPTGTQLTQTANTGSIPGTWTANLASNEGALTDGNGNLRIRTWGLLADNSTFWLPEEPPLTQGSAFVTVHFSQYVLNQALPSGGFGELLRFSTNNAHASHFAQAMVELRRNGTTNAVEVRGYSSSTSTSSTGTFSPWVILAASPSLSNGLTVSLEVDYTNSLYRLHARVGQGDWMENIGTGNLYAGADLRGIRLQTANRYAESGDEVWIDRITVSDTSPLGPPDLGNSIPFLIAEGTPYESIAYLIDSGAPGPTVFAVGGMGQSVVAVRDAFDLIKQWNLEKGRLVFLPEFVLPANDPARTGFTTSFPRSAGETPSNPAAAALWSYLSDLQPDKLLELRHSTATPWSTNSGSYGNVLLASGSNISNNMAAAMRARVDLSIAAESHKYVRITWPISGLLVRAAGDFLNADGVISYVTTSGQHAGIRRDQYLTQVYAVMERAGMIPYGQAQPGLPLSVMRQREYERLSRGKLAVAIYDGHGSTGAGVPETWAELRSRSDTFVAILTDEDIRRGQLAAFDAVAFTGGAGGSQANSLDESGRQAVRDFVHNGGGYLGICAGSYLAMSNFSWGLGIINAGTKSNLWQRGVGQVEMELTEAGIDMFGDTHAYSTLLYANGPIIEPYGRTDLPEYDVLAWFRTELAENGTPPGIMVDSPALVSAPYGAGRVVLFSPHPEQTEGMRYFVSRAIDWAAQVSKEPNLAITQETVAAGTSYESVATVIDTGVPGPRVLLYGGLLQELQTVRDAFARIQDWPIQNGSIVMLPRFEISAGDSAATGFTSSFPRSAGDFIVNPAAAALWEWVSALQPDWAMELRDVDAQPWNVTSSGLGNTVLSMGTAEAVNGAVSARRRANFLVSEVNHRFYRNTPPALGLLARSMGDLLGTRSMICYVSTQVHGPEMRRDLHLTLAYGLLEREGMVPFRTPLPGLPEPVIAQRQYDTLGEGKLRVAVFDGHGVTGGGVPSVLLELEPREDIFVTVLTDRDIAQGMLDHFDVVMFTGGTGGSQAYSLNEGGRQIVRDFLADGGGYIGICAGGYLAMHNYTWGLKIINARTKSGQWMRGEGQVVIEMTERGQEIFDTTLTTTNVAYVNGPIMEPAGAANLPPYEVLGWFRTELAENGTPVGIMVDSPMAIAAPYGLGRVVVLSPHPEASASLRHMISGAVNWVGYRNEAPEISFHPEASEISLPSADYELVLRATATGHGRPDARETQVVWSAPETVTFAQLEDDTIATFGATGSFALQARAENRLGFSGESALTVRVADGTSALNVEPIDVSFDGPVFTNLAASWTVAGEDSPDWILRDGPAGVDLNISGQTATTTFSVAGDYLFTLRRDTPGYSIFRRLPVTVSPLTAQGWIASWLGEGDHSLSADPLGTGRSNLLNFALLASPHANGREVLPLTERDGDGRLLFSYRRHRGAAAGSAFNHEVNGLRYTPVFSADLVNTVTGSDAWETVGAPVNNGDGSETATFRSKTAGPRGFAWLQVETVE